eukprot:4588223-Pleurochrysis_carterae.AAC.1
MPGFGSNHLAHRQPHAVKRAAGFRSQPSDHIAQESEISIAGCRGRCAIRSGLSAVAVTRALQRHTLESGAHPSDEQRGQLLWRSAPRPY